MSRRINDINLGSLIIDGSIFGQDCDSPFPLNIVGIHDPFLHGLIFTEHSALL